ncbi:MULTISPECIES: hypothetical protein [unclassified Pseudomonas]|uniref:hypothetical protein n=1 Tax=unclassified Pseudomonas TaxID=196821 RepID=UPI0011142CF4|nr:MULTISPECIES: hypothetical protein [unclassified Pseudomonas]
MRSAFFGVAAQLIGDKSPRHQMSRPQAADLKLAVDSFRPKACPRQVDNPISKAVLAIFRLAPPFSTEGFYVFQQSPRRFTFASAVYLAQRQADGDQPAQGQ